MLYMSGNFFIDEYQLEILTNLLLAEGRTSLEVNQIRGGIIARCRKLCDPSRSGFAGGAGNYIPRDREQVMEMVVWTFLHSFKGGLDSDGDERQVYGGFVRDYIVRGEAPNDIDSKLGFLESTQIAMNQGLKLQWLN